MSFKNRNLSVINYANGWTMWHYSTEPGEDINKVKTDPKYFADIYHLCACGDLMLITHEGRTETMQILEIKPDYVKLGV